MTVLFILAIAFVPSLTYLGLTLAAAARKARGPRLVVCPETITPEVVHLDAWRIAVRSLFFDRDLAIRSCTRARRSVSCEKDCLSQVESAKDGCRVEDRLARWEFGSQTKRNVRQRRNPEPIETLDRILAEGSDLSGPLVQRGGPCGPPNPLAEDSPLAAVRVPR